MCLMKSLHWNNLHNSPQNLLVEVIGVVSVETGSNFLTLIHFVTPEMKSAAEEICL